MDLIDANKKSVTLMKYIGPFTPRDPASDSKHRTNIFVSKGSQNLEKNPMIIGANTSSDVKISHQKLLSADEDSNNKNSENLGIVIKSNMADRSRVGLDVNGKKTLTNLCTDKTCIDVSASDQLKSKLGTAGINKAVKQYTNLSGGLVDVNVPNKSIFSLTAGESSHLSSNIIDMSGIKMAATPHLDHVTSKHGTKFSFAKSQYSSTSGLMDVQKLRSELSGANLRIRKGDSDLQGPALLDPKINIAVGGCVLDTTGLDAGGKLNQGKVKVNPESLNKGNTGIPLPAMFANCQFALDLSMNMSFSEKTNLRKAITSHGGIVSFIVTKKLNQWRHLARIGKPVSYGNEFDGNISKWVNIQKLSFKLVGTGQQFFLKAIQPCVLNMEKDGPASPRRFGGENEIVPRIRKGQKRRRQFQRQDDN